MSGLLDLFERWKMGEFNTGETVGSTPPAVLKLLRSVCPLFKGVLLLKLVDEPYVPSSFNFLSLVGSLNPNKPFLH